ncbi:mitochondrial dynamics protein MID49 [Aquila chrysaetos chrysaetos]|uniref:Mitochondrial elongation factor 2 n=1 Tax=Aquila chrysaetos chrysaetos TaxID=223781 RepID=A0A663FAN6_AQUCH|nr:mitochondrial dynamics protein MID49 [Aquila chrysaetos chrysaetos]XP_029857938.1 mitochondrial dynamics protein MID49 [Aquila chrysaetos chrysaetos]
MAEFTSQRGKRQEDGGLGSVLDLLLANARLVLGVSGAAVLAIATLAVKRLIDRATSPRDEGDPKAEQKTLEESWQDLALIKATPKLPKKQRREDLSEPLLSPARPPVPEPRVCSAPPETPQVEFSPPRCLTLQEKLLSHYSSRLAVPEAQASLAPQLARSICAQLQNFLQIKCPELPFGSLFLSGPLLDGLGALAADHIHLMLPVALDAALWSLIPGEDTVVRNPQYWMIKRTDLEYFPRGRSPWDRFIVGRYLSSNALNETLHKMLVASINWPAIGSLLGSVIHPVVASQELKLEVKHDQVELSIALFPVVEMEDKVLLAAPPEGLVENLWLESFYRAEVSKLKELDAGDAGARQRCLRILNGICKSHPALHKLSGSPLTHVVLHLSATNLDWAEESLADRFQQVLEELVGYLEKGVLPSYFNHKINLFCELLEEEIDEMGFMLYRAVSEPELLLKEK